MTDYEIERSTAHFPANGARVIHGWADSGRKWLLDDPVLWFDAAGEPVITTSDLADPIRNGGENTRWCLYHPDARRIDDAAFSARDTAVRYVSDALDVFLMEGGAA